MIKILLGLILKADDISQGYRRIVGYIIMAFAVFMMMGAWINHNFRGADQSSFNEALGISKYVFLVGVICWSYGWGHFLGRAKEQLKSKL